MPLITALNDQFHSMGTLGTARRQDLAPSTGKVTMGELSLLMGEGPEKRDDADEQLALTLWRVRRNATLLHEGWPGMALYVLRSGSMKCLRCLEDGYEQVLSFVLRGDLMGFEALHSGQQPVTAVAMEDSTVYSIPLRHLRGLRHRCPSLDGAIYHALSRQLGRAAEHAGMMAAVASDVRLARFLLWMSARLGESGQSPRRLLLRMGRRDIASLLGVAHETVSRSFSSLADEGYIAVNNREVVILQADRLRAHASCTRGPCEVAAAPPAASHHVPAVAA